MILGPVLQLRDPGVCLSSVNPRDFGDLFISKHRQIERERARHSIHIDI